MVKKYFTQQRGVSSIEMVIGVSILGLILVYSIYTVTTYINNARSMAEKTEALYLAEDGLELLRFIRDGAWSNIDTLTSGTTYYLSVTPTTIQTTGTPEIIGMYTRSFTLEPVYRDPVNDDIVASTTSGSVADPDSKYVTMMVSWGTPATDVSLVTILADIAQ